MMKALIITIIFLFHFLLPLKSNDSADNKLQVMQSAYSTAELGEVFRELGTAKKEISPTEMLEVNAKIYRKKVSVSSQKSFKQFKGDNVYGFSVVCESSSSINGELTSTWVFGLWVRVNNVPITQPLYPRGKDILVYTTPTVLHYFETDEENPLIKIGWTKSVPDPKIVR